MKRREFLRLLKQELRKRRDIQSEEVLFYYDELIQDAVDNGESEEAFIANLGSVREIVRRIEDDEEFIAEVKGQNMDVVKNALSLTVKIIGYFVLGLVAFIVMVTGFSVLVSGIAVVFAAIVKVFVTVPTDIYGYLAMAGVALIGLSFIIFSLALIKWFIHQAKPTLLTIFRNTKEFLNRRGK